VICWPSISVGAAYRFPDRRNGGFQPGQAPGFFRLADGGRGTKPATNGDRTVTRMTFSEAEKETA